MLCSVFSKSCPRFEPIYGPTTNLDMEVFHYFGKAGIAPAGLWYLDVKPAEAATLIREFVDEG